MLSSRLRTMPSSSSRILDSYLSGLRSEVARLLTVREHSTDLLSLAQLDLHIKLKLQLIDDVSYCLAEEEDDGVDIAFDCESGMTSPTPSIT